jgi:hypothetical protein
MSNLSLGCTVGVRLGQAGIQAGERVPGVGEDGQLLLRRGLGGFDLLVDRVEAACIYSLELASAHRDERSSTTPPTRRHTWAAKGRFRVSNVSVGW